MDDHRPSGGDAASPARIAEALRARCCPPDAVFDAFLPEDLADLSGDQWTPLEVAIIAGSWLAELGSRSVVDIGSGPGKFCVAAALACEASFVGLEQNPRFVSVGRSLARLFAVEHRVRFLRGALGESALPEADAYYLYNPFAQHLFAQNAAGEAAPDYARYSRDVMLAQDTFRRAPPGTVVLTYNGFGGIMPASYEACRVERELPCVLRMWRKSRPWDDGGFSIADAD